VQLTNSHRWEAEIIKHLLVEANQNVCKGANSRLTRLLFLQLSIHPKRAFHSLKSFVMFFKKLSGSVMAKKGF
jgi:hypothetical protein